MTLEFILYYWLWYCFMTSNCCCYKRKILNMFNMACCMYAWVIVPHIAMSCSWFVCEMSAASTLPIWFTHKQLSMSMIIMFHTNAYHLCSTLSSGIHSLVNWVLSPFFPCIIPFFRKKGLMPMDWAFALLHQKTFEKNSL